MLKLEEMDCQQTNHEIDNLTTKISLNDTKQLHHTFHSSLSNNTKNIQLWYQSMFSELNRYVLVRTLLAITKTYQMSSIVQLLKSKDQ